MFVNTLSAGLLLAAATTCLATPVAGLDERAPSRFKYYTMPTNLSGPCDLTTGPDGAVYVQDFLVNKIARIDPVTGDIKEYDIPYTNEILNISLPGQAPGRSGLTACAIQPGSDGNIYAASGVRNQFLKLDLKTQKVSVFELAGSQLGNLQPFNDLWRAEKGMFLTQTTANLITFFNYKTNKLKSWKIPTPNSGPLGLYVTEDDGAVWFAEFLAGKIARFNATDGTFVEYPLPLVSGLLPGVVRAETRTKGRRLLWFTGFGGNTMISIDRDNGEVKTYPVTSLLSFPTVDTVDSFGRVWFSTLTANMLNYIIPRSGEVKTIPFPDTIIPAPIGLVPAASVSVHYGPGNKIWFSELAKNRVGTYQLQGCGKTITPCTK